MTHSDAQSNPPLRPGGETSTSTFLGNQLHYAQLLSESLGGPLPELDQSTLDGTSSILDLGCGVGAWALIVASRYDHMHITGIDGGASAINDAQTLAWAHRKQENLTFAQMNPAGPLAFDDNTFDLVNANNISWKVAHRKNWPQILAEAYRVARPGGIIRLHELEVAISNSPANQHLYGSFLQALVKAGLSYSVDGRTFGFTPTLQYLLREAGCSDARLSVACVDVSSATELHEGWRDNLIVLDQFVTPFVVSTGVASLEERKAWFEQMKDEVDASWYRGALLFVTVWGRK